MQIQQINVEGFGTLSHCQISPLESGLTVVYGMNGSGKTTLLEFVRGVFSGYDHARQLNLLPPLNSGNPGGSLTLRLPEGQVEVIRHARAEGEDTLAFAVRHELANVAADVRKSINRLPEQLIRTLFMVSGYESHSLANLVQVAREYGIELASKRTATTWLNSRIHALQQQRANLYQTIVPQGTLAQLQDQHKHLTAKWEEAKQGQQTRIAGWQNAIERLRLRIQRLQTEASWLAQELHAAESDLTEVQTRLWSRKEAVVEEQETIEQIALLEDPEWKLQIAELDQEITNAQQVLRDLANSRMKLSVTKAGLVGSEVPDIDITFHRQRTALAELESQADQLASIAEKLKSASECLCGTKSSSLETAVQQIRNQVWLLCQELSRQQSAQQQWLLQTQREGVDDCESELISQIRILRLRREEIVRTNAIHIEDQIPFRNNHESAWCECGAHAAAAQHLPSCKRIVTPQIITHLKTIIVSGALPGDAEAEKTLLARHYQLRSQWLDAVKRLRDARAELETLEQGGPEIAADRTVQNDRNELSLLDQQIEEGRQQWQTLKLVEGLLERTQSKLNTEVIAPVIKEASALLARMTSERYTGFRFVPATSELRIQSADGTELAPSALSRGTQEQAALCFRLALAREFHRRGRMVPLVLDDVLVDSDEHRSKAAVEVLVECAKSQQILFLTCQEHLLELFAMHKISIVDLPGSVRPSLRTYSDAHGSNGHVSSSGPIVPHVPVSLLSLPPVTPPTTLEVVEKPVPVVIPAATASEDSNSKAITTRLHANSVYWLEPTSPVDQVPSIGSQMARRLATIGVREVRDLIELNPEILEIPLNSLQMSDATLKQWKSEARMLCCVPHLTGRGAQLLVLCGFFTPAELGQSDARTILSKVKKLRGDGKHSLSLPWLNEEKTWPNQDEASAWVRSGKAARSWRKLRESTEKSARSNGIVSGKIREGDLVLHAVNRVTSPSTTNPASSTEAVRLESEVQEEVVSDADRTWRFYLQGDSQIVDAPSIGPKSAERLNAIGIYLVSDLIEQPAQETATALGRREVTTEIVTEWQQQALLMCTVPQLRGHDAQILVACDVTTAEQLAQMVPHKLFAIVDPFVRSKDGQRLLRSSKAPDLEEVTEWIECARQSPMLKAV
ncbi:DUF4332 domain-containing protein [Planctomicrobium sp. SH527]|uniref:DUF4332 domain-containing protein n=1 Tax=Planctomicrobium sp. SH527 TaxID=3448123 RepID=UPI003F5AFAD3